MTYHLDHDSSWLKYIGFFLGLTVSLWGYAVNQKQHKLWYEIQLLLFEQSLPASSEKWIQQVELPHYIDKKAIQLVTLEEMKIQFQKIEQKKRENLWLTTSSKTSTPSTIPWLLSHERYQSPNAILRPNIAEELMIALPLTGSFLQDAKKIKKCYTILYASRWRIPISESLSPLTFFIDNQSIMPTKSSLIGRLTFEKKKELHLTIQWFYKKKQAYIIEKKTDSHSHYKVINQKIMMPLSQCLYIDHPCLGFLLQATLYQRHAPIKPILPNLDKLQFDTKKTRS
ncbi:MAG: hypothetical protein HAW62_03570 [Endozoicomonadaceae bacterium]|nr:hypothetical protein [Endozoicomonadaceae bacterium]